MKTKITVLLFCGMLASSLAPAAESVAQAREAQSLAGTIRDANGQPLPQARVTLTRIGRSTLADATGRFVFRNVPTGTHRVQATLIGYAPASQEVSVGAAGSTQVDFAPNPGRNIALVYRVLF